MAQPATKINSSQKEMYLEEDLGTDLRPYYKQESFCGRRGLIGIIFFLLLVIVVVSVGWIIDKSSSDDSTTTVSAFAGTNHAGATYLSTSFIVKAPEGDDEEESHFVQFMTKFGKDYPDEEERALRKSIFLENSKKYAEKNAMRTSPKDATFGWTKFSDWTKEEFQQLLGFKRKDDVDYLEEIGVDDYLRGDSTDFSDLETIDWRSHGKVTDVKDQAYCGSCWAFSAVETLESAMLMAETAKAGTLLSTQQVVSCDNYYGDGLWDLGCDGGTTGGAYNYIQSIANGMESEADYPYRSGTTPATLMDSLDCDFNGHRIVPDTKPIDFTYVVAPCFTGECADQDENQLGVSLTNRGPLAICLAAELWDGYTGGILNYEQCGGATTRSASAVDHCVQLVGMNIEEGYWMVRNSWGYYWGDAGYIYLSMGDNTCGVANEVMMVEVQEANTNPNGPADVSNPDNTTIERGPADGPWSHMGGGDDPGGDDPVGHMPMPGYGR